MKYEEINNRWKSFLVENAFKEDKLVNKKDKKKDDKEEKGKEIIVSEEDVKEWEEFDEAVINEPSGSDTNKAVNSVEEESLEEMSAMSGGAVQGYAGNAFAKTKKKNKLNR